MSPNLAIFGDSHIVALREAYAQRAVDSVAEDEGEISFTWLGGFPALLAPFFSVHGSELRFSDRTPRVRLRETTGLDHLDLADGTARNVISMALTTNVLIRSRTWSFTAPWRAWQAGQKLRVVSDAVMQAIVLSHFQHILQFHAVLSRCGIPCIAMHAPPPRRDNPKISKDREPIVLEVDRLARIIIEKELQELGVGIASPPEVCYDADGFLKLEYHNISEDGKDVHHANTAYGELMLQRVFAVHSAMSQHRQKCTPPPVVDDQEQSPATKSKPGTWVSPEIQRAPDG